MALNKNRKAFLDMLSVSEGTSTSTATKNDGYDVIVTGEDEVPEVFTDYSTHPFAGGRKPKCINALHQLFSTASGRYQHMLHDWAHYKALLQLPDFGPTSQDLWAIQLIRECHALPLIDGGSFKDAVKAVAHLWASLPGAGYAQHENRLDRLETVYLGFGGLLTSVI